MARYSGEEALQMILHSEEEFTFSSEEDRDSDDDERLHFEERTDPAEDFPASCYEENVVASPLPSPGHEGVVQFSVRSRIILRDTVQRRVKSQGTWRTKTFPCPAPVTCAYNQHMTCLISCYSTTPHSTKQNNEVVRNQKDFSTLLGHCCHQCFHCAQKELYGNLSHKEFMEQLITKLCGVSQKVAPKRTSSDYIPGPGTDLTSDARNVASAGRKSCVHCKAVHGKKQKTPWKCQACDVHLCLQLNRNCFQEWHRDV
ncbi:uncharacterized protein LOC117596561 [Pangasianodon hypophthalmus]|uniref:uncharacterized protein LOC117596561 n=1 Tax=Pangasianodon hypophthalmus TaxID=310915 RepID=UPI00147EA9CF|nr:uncharacterized protein LOC117596561 [Pangasianodon hypophthalmus]